MSAKRFVRAANGGRAGGGGESAGHNGMAAQRSGSGEKAAQKASGPRPAGEHTHANKRFLDFQHLGKAAQ